MDSTRDRGTAARSAKNLLFSPGKAGVEDNVPPIKDHEPDARANTFSISWVSTMRVFPSARSVFEDFDDFLY
jgi:hypothetical protein